MLFAPLEGESGAAGGSTGGPHGGDDSAEDGAETRRYPWHHLRSHLAGLPPASLTAWLRDSDCVAEADQRLGKLQGTLLRTVLWTGRERDWGSTLQKVLRHCCFLFFNRLQRHLLFWGLIVNMASCYFSSTMMPQTLQESGVKPTPHKNLSCEFL